MINDMKIYSTVESAKEVAKRNGLLVHTYSDYFEVEYRTGGNLGVVYSAEGLYNLIVGFEIGLNSLKKGTK